jgi:hypothetical protein
MMFERPLKQLGFLITLTVVTIFVVATAGGDTASDFQILADKFATDLLANNSEKIKSWYLPSAFFTANLVLLANGKPEYVILQDRELVVKYWTRVGIAAIKIEVKEAQTAGVAGPGYMEEKDIFQITTQEKPPRSISGLRVVLWKPSANGSFSIEEENWSDLKYCTIGPDGVTTTCHD